MPAVSFPIDQAAAQVTRNLGSCGSAPGTVSACQLLA